MFDHKTKKSDSSGPSVKKAKHFNCLIPAAVSGALMMGLSSVATAQENKSAEEPEKTKVGLFLEEVIVTGVPNGLRSGVTKFESSLSVTDFDEDRLREIGSSNTTGIFAEVPGVWAEATGGGSGNNLFIRGLPAGGAYRFTKLNVDGLPSIEEQANFVNPDGIFKLDETIEKLEAIRGGSSGVFASNSPGGLFNFVSKKGTQEFEGLVKLELADYDYQRADLFLSGPINETTTYAVGGFYRKSTGVRDAGFDGDDGGQIRASLTKELEKGEFTLRASVIDDKNIFYLPFIARVEGGEIKSFPGISQLTGTNVTDDAASLTIVQPGGRTEVIDSTDGIYNKAFNIGTEFSYELANEWVLTNKNRYASTEWDANMHIPFGVGEANSIIGGFLAPAQAAFGSDVSGLAVRFVEDGVGGTSTFQFADGNSAGENGNGFLMSQALFAWDTSSDMFVNDFSLSRSFEVGESTHNISIGNYYSKSDYEVFNQTPLFLTELTSSPRLVNVYAVNDAGDVLGAVTQNGISSYGCCGGLLAANYTVDTDIMAFYASDEWVVNDNLRIDIAARYEKQDFDGSVTQDGVFNLSDSNPLGGLPTLADDSVVFRDGGPLTQFSVEQSVSAFSLGANYVVNDSVSVYGRISDGERTPDINFLANAARANPGDPSGAAQRLPVNQLLQAEGGVKFNFDKFQAFLTLYSTEFEDQVSAIVAPQDADGNPLNATPLLSTDTTGIETEFEFGPFAGFSLNAKATFQKPEVSNVSLFGPDAARASTNLSGDIGNLPPRVPETMITIRPKYSFVVNDNMDGAVHLNIYHAGDRFGDFGNNILIPSYTTIGAGGILNVGENLSFSFIAENLTNEIGFTEGNPRTNLLAGGGQRVIVDNGRSVHGRNVRFSVTYRF